MELLTFTPYVSILKIFRLENFDANVSNMRQQGSVLEQLKGGIFNPCCNLFVFLVFKYITLHFKGLKR